MTIPRLIVVIPYRDRLKHLRLLVPALSDYLACTHPDIPREIHVVEQHGNKPFNRGMICNVGFDLTRGRGDYFVFHDVDYLPSDVDYSYCDRPTRLIWHGLRTQEDYDGFFGGVVALSRRDFELVNGFSNAYEGWGFEDADLLERCMTRGLSIDRRDGVFRALDHGSRGWVDGLPTPEHRRTRHVFDQRRRTGDWCAEGLTSLDYGVIETKPIGARLRFVDVEDAFLHTVELQAPNARCQAIG